MEHKVKFSISLLTHARKEHGTVFLGLKTEILEKHTGNELNCYLGLRTGSRFADSVVDP